QAVDLRPEAVFGEQLAALGVAFGLALLAQHRLAAVHAGEGKLGMRFVDDALQRRRAAQQSVDLVHLREQVEGLLVDADAQRLAERVRLGVRGAVQHRPARRREHRARLAGQVAARLDLTEARRTRDIDEADRHVDRQNGKTLAGFREGLHDSYVQRAIGAAPADDPAGATAVGARDDHSTPTTWPSWP